MYCNRFFSAFVSVGLVGLGVGATRAVCAQGLTADYERAERLPRLAQGKVVGGAVKANWAAGEADRFWYRADRGEGRREFLVVDAPSATRKPAFDHAQLAAALGKTLGRRVDAERLPIDDLTLAGDNGVPAGSIRIQASGRAYLCNLSTYALTADPAGLTQLPGLSPTAGPRASETTGRKRQSPL